MPSTGSLLLGLALLLLVGLFIVRPLFFSSATPVRAVRSKREQLQAEKEAIVAQIRALDFDHETSKIPDAEYQQTRERLLAAAAAVLQQLDSLEPAGGGDADSADEIEAAIAQRRRQRVGADIEAAVAQRRARPQPAVAIAGNGHGAVQDSSAGFCPQCGQPHDSGDLFCAYCGQRLD
jgi:acetoin utilization deacetylase AcuC-like enzyme